MALQTNLLLVISSTITMVLAAVVPTFSCSSSGLRYTVGNTPWTIPPYQDFYTNWSSSHFFKIGDSLVFKFDTGRYDVIQVSGQEYRRCTTFNPFRIINDGPAIVPLTEIGVFYFICNISTYCNLGQKVDVTVHDCSEETPPPPPPPPLALPPQSSPPYAGPVLSPVFSPIGSGNSPMPPIISPVLPSSTEPVSSPVFSPIGSDNSPPLPIIIPVLPPSRPSAEPGLSPIFSPIGSDNSPLPPIISPVLPPSRPFAEPILSPVFSPIGSGNSPPPPIISPVLPPSKPSVEPISRPIFSPIGSGNSLPHPPDRSGIIMVSRGKFGVDCGGLIISSLVFGMSMVLGF